MVHLQNKGFLAKNAKELLRKAVSLAEDGVVIRDARVSGRHLELDLSVSEGKLESSLELLSKIAPIASYTEISERNVGNEDAIEHAKSLFNSERYWECHEVLEGVWKPASGSEKELLQGIILTCAAFVHGQKDEVNICVSVLRRALAKLQLASGKYHGIDVDRFKQMIANILETRTIEYFKI